MSETRGALVMPWWSYLLIPAAVLRGGEEIAVHRRDPRGVRVRSGDEIRLGRALLRVDFVG